MSVFRTILCPVDASSFSRRALQFAATLGRLNGAEVVVMSVRPVVVPPALWLTRETAVPFEEPGERERAVEALHAFVTEATGGSPGRTFVTDGPIVPEILRVAGALPADLIVMGAHGLGGFDRLLLGSVTEKVLRKAACPVLVIPRATPASPDATPEGFKRILCGVDRSAASMRALDYALSLARQASARLVVVHALEDISAEDPKFASHFNVEECWREIAPDLRASYEAMLPAESRAGLEVDIRVPFGRAHRELLRAAEETGADLIVLGTAGWNAPFGATTHHVVREAGIPVLTVPPPARA